uniref:hypothetical protein n=1 Tax=Bacteroides uniformis TaxID=820 RepID=UPI0040278663
MKQLEEKKAASLDEKGTVEMIREDFPVKEYESPQTKKTAVETEGGFCASEPVTGDQSSENDAVEVEEYISIENNEITFD